MEYIQDRAEGHSQSRLRVFSDTLLSPARSATKHHTPYNVSYITNIRRIRTIYNEPSTLQPLTIYHFVHLFGIHDHRNGCQPIRWPSRRAQIHSGPTSHVSRVRQRLNCPPRRPIAIQQAADPQPLPKHLHAGFGHLATFAGELP